MPVLQYEDALAYLQKSNTTEGSSVYEHLTRVLAKVLDEKPPNALDLFEQSVVTKRTAFEPKESSPLVPISSAADAARAVATNALFGNPDLPIDPETGEPVEAGVPNDYECEDVLADGSLLDALGVGLGRSEMYAAMLAVKKLGEDSTRNVATVRFFGKFFGLYSDYYVFETTLKDPPEIPEAPEGEVPLEQNTGANNYVYFVTAYLGGPFSQLPYVTPDQVKAARAIKKFLTGRLESQVSTYPAFVGTEANYLRAQIARISSTTVCCPVGCFNANEEGGMDKNEEYEGVPGKDAAQPTTWTHRYPHLKKQGRCELFKREPPEGEEDTFEPTEDEQEEGPEALAPLEGDVPLADGTTPSWSGLSSSSSENVKFQVGGVRSNLWPGAFCAAKDKAFTNIYVGWGQKNAPFLPQPPPPVAKEFELGLVESLELPPKPVPPPPEEEGDE